MAITISPKEYSNILKVCASQEDVRKEVLKNHDNNLWWPLTIEDWKLRMLIAGLSARVSYRMIKSFQEVVGILNSRGFNRLISMPEKEFRSLIKPLGLTNMRVKFWHSLIKFINYIEKEEINIYDLEKDKFIDLIQEKVFGASYKIAQCCVLYVRGYYCGVMPVDSGMLNLLSPAIGLPAPNSSFGHEVIRRQLEALTSSVDCRKIAFEKGYKSLTFPAKKPLTWWAHLVLIYYKRLYSSKNNPAGTPLQNSSLTKNLVSQKNKDNKSKLGGVKNVIFEGLDGTGKTTIADTLTKVGFKKVSFQYNPQVEDLFVFYKDIIDKYSCIQKRFVFDRMFLSERVYGPALRSKNRLSKRQFISLLQKLKKQNTILIYLHAPLKVLLKRVEKSDIKILEENYAELERNYSATVKFVKQYLPVIKINTQKNSPEQIFSKLMKFKIP